MFSTWFRSDFQLKFLWFVCLSYGFILHLLLHLANNCENTYFEWQDVFLSICFKERKVLCHKTNFQPFLLYSSAYVRYFLPDFETAKKFNKQSPGFNSLSNVPTFIIMRLINEHLCWTWVWCKKNTLIFVSVQSINLQRNMKSDTICDPATMSLTRTSSTDYSLQRGDNSAGIESLPGDSNSFLHHPCHDSNGDADGIHTCSPRLSHPEILPAEFITRHERQPDDK